MLEAKQLLTVSVRSLHLHDNRYKHNKATSSRISQGGNPRSHLRSKRTELRFNACQNRGRDSRIYSLGEGSGTGQPENEWLSSGRGEEGSWGDEATPEGGVQSACAVVDAVLKASQEQDFDTMLLMGPDRLESDEAPPPPRRVGFWVSEKMAELESHVMFDATARRGLLFNAPSTAQVLSFMLLNPSTFVQRAAITLPAGEEAVLTFRLEVDQEWVPQFRGMGTRNRWVLKSITGEPGSDDCPSSVDPRHPPQQIVEAQLRALRDDWPERVYAFASPANKDAIGSLSQFTEMLRSPTYVGLVGLQDFKFLKGVQVSPTKFMQLVGVTTNGSNASSSSSSGSTTHQVFAWGMGLQLDPGPCEGCWMTDSVHPISDSPPFTDWEQYM